MLQSSKDEILKKEMPPAITRVENSSTDLSEAGKGLTLSPESTEHQKMLLNGCRGWQEFCLMLMCAHIHTGTHRDLHT